MKTLLIVDDEASLRDALATFFEGPEYKVLQAYSGEQALEKLATEAVDLIITDFSMGSMDGVVFSKKVRENVSETLPIFMHSGSDMKALEEYCDIVGLFDYDGKFVLRAKNFVSLEGLERFIKGM
jgi:CheY-like chemotaxis protein